MTRKRRIIVGTLLVTLTSCLVFVAVGVYLLWNHPIGHAFAYSTNPGAWHAKAAAPWLPVIAAIERYEQDHGSPPPSLQDLVPAYLDAALLPTVTHPPPYSRTGDGYTVVVAAGGWKDYISYSSDDQKWYYLDDSGDTPREIDVTPARR